MEWAGPSSAGAAAHLKRRERSQGHTGDTELSGFRARTEGAAFSQTEVMADDIVPLQIPSRTGRGGCHI